MAHLAFWQPRNGIMSFRLISKDVHIDFLKYTKTAAVLSGILCAIGFWSMAQMFSGAQPMGIDFSGGTVIHVEPEKPHQIADLRAALKAASLERVDIQEIRGVKGQGFRIRLGPEAGAPGEAAQNVVEILKNAFGNEKFLVPLIAEVGPAASKRLQLDALKAVGLALMGIMAYVSFRFEFRYAVAAILAAMHDCVAALGLATLAGFDFDLLMVSALLIIMGYSLNDTVVIFDRMRENLRAKTGEKFPDIINRSLNEVLARTVITGGTTFLVLLSLFFLGGEILGGFALCLIIGVVVGTYSSIFVAPPLVIKWSK